MTYTEKHKVYIATWREKHRDAYLAINRKHQATFQAKKRAWRQISTEFLKIGLN